MNRSALALLGLLALPLSAAAQNDRPLLSNEPPPEQLPVSRFSVTPYLGFRVPFNTGNEYVTLTDGTQYRLSWERGGGPMAGLDVAARVAGPVQALVGFAWSGSRSDNLTAESESGTITTYSASGPTYYMAKAGVQVRLADPSPDNRRHHPSALITVAPALVWTDFPDAAGYPAAANGSSTHFAANLGADAATRIGKSGRWSLQLGLQDYVIFWNTDDLAVRDATTAQALYGSSATIDYDYNTSNMLTLRLGVSYRFR